MENRWNKEFSPVLKLAMITISSACIAFHATSTQVPHDKSEQTGTSAEPTYQKHLFMPPNPTPPNQATAVKLHLPHLLSERTTNYFHATPSQAKNIQLVAKRLNGVVIQPGDTFSYYKTVGPYTAENGYGWGRAFVGDKIVPSMGGGVCQGASTLYSTLLRTTLPVVERHNHSLTVPYLPPGEDATVASTVLNFRFRNNQATPVLITAAADPAHKYLTVAIWAANAGPKITVHHEILSELPFKTVHQWSKELKIGENRVLFPGQIGYRVKTWVNIASNGKVEHRSVGEDTYIPSPRIIEEGKA